MNLYNFAASYLLSCVHTSCSYDYFYFGYLLPLLVNKVYHKYERHTNTDIHCDKTSVWALAGKG